MLDSCKVFNGPELQLVRGDTVAIQTQNAEETGDTGNPADVHLPPVFDLEEVDFSQATE